MTITRVRCGDAIASGRLRAVKARQRVGRNAPVAAPPNLPPAGTADIVDARTTDDFQARGLSNRLKTAHTPLQEFQEGMMPNTVQFHRVLRARPERVYRAFLDADAMVKWLPPNGFTGKVHEMDARAGGKYKMSFTNFTSGKSHSFGGEYLELVPNERIRWTDRFDDPGLPGEMTVTVRLRQVAMGTEVNIVQEGLPDVIPPDACTLGWQESLTLLAKLVEAEIPD